MSDNQELNQDLPTLSEKEVLLQRAKLMGLSVSNNSSVETLRKKIDEAMANDDDTGSDNDEAPVGNPLAPAPAKPQSLRARLIAEKMPLIRVRVTNMDPADKGLQGEVFTLANSVLGTIKHWVPYAEASDDGWHLPKWVVDNMRERKYVQHNVIKDKRTGREYVVSKIVRKFAVEVLDPLTPAELKKLASAQLAAGTSQVG